MNDPKRNAVRMFTRGLAEIRVANGFNPYGEVCGQYDRPDAAALRRRNLENVLYAALVDGVDSIWVGRDLGYRGGRRTGLAFTDDLHLADHQEMMRVPLARATEGLPVKERTAAVVWEMLVAIQRPILLWNVFPFHPHEPGEPLSNRTHTRREGKACRSYLTWILESVRPERVFAIGRDAESTLAGLGVRSEAIRHPSYGGQSEFRRTLAARYGLATLPKDRSPGRACMTSDCAAAITPSATSPEEDPRSPSHLAPGAK